jgi:hypothetical protein
MNNFDYKLNFSESIIIAGETTKLYEYDIVLDNEELGYIRIKHNVEDNKVEATLRMYRMDLHTASGTARRMLEDLFRQILKHDSKAVFSFNTNDMQTVAILSMNGIDKNFVIK